MKLSRRLVALPLVAAFALATMGQEGCDGTSDSAGTEGREEQAEARNEPAKPRTLKQRVTARIKDSGADTDGLRIDFEGEGRSREALVYLELADNLTEGLVQRGAESDAQDVMQAIYDSPDAKSFGAVTVLSESTLIDELGNEREGVAFSVTLDGETGRGINWDNIDSIDIRDLWDINVDLIR